MARRSARRGRPRGRPAATAGRSVSPTAHEACPRRHTGATGPAETMGADDPALSMHRSPGGV